MDGASSPSMIREVPTRISACMMPLPSGPVMRRSSSAPNAFL